MKQTIKLRMYATIVALSLITNYVFAQFQQVPISTNNSWMTKTTPPVGAIAVGTGYPNGTYLPSTKLSNDV